MQTRFKFLLVALVAIVFTAESDAGPFLRKFRERFGGKSCQTTTTPSSSFRPAYSTNAGSSCSSCVPCGGGLSFGTAVQYQPFVYPMTPVRYSVPVQSCPNGQCPVR